jgi:hypothetical protein
MWHGPARDCLSECAQGSGDRWPYPHDLRLSFGDAFLLSRSFSAPFVEVVASRSGDFVASASPIGSDRDSSLGVVNDRPSVDINVLRPLPASPWLVRAARLHLPCGVLSAGSGFHLRPGVATLRTRSVRVVPPDFDGLLRWTSCRFVAPCSRPWGSPRFGTVGFASLGGSRGTSARPAVKCLTVLPGLRWLEIHPLDLRKGQQTSFLPHMAHAPPGPSPVALHPSKLSPRPQPLHVTVVVALSPLSPIQTLPAWHVP